MSRRPSGPSVEATITELAPGGEGVAICAIGGERRAVFVPGVALGETVEVVLDPSRRPARGRVVGIVRPSVERVAPPCPHVDRCGGCDWMHLSVAEQIRSHASIVRAILPRAFAGAEIVAHPAPHPLGYRTRARVHVDARRGRVSIGAYARASHDPVDVDACVALHPCVDEARRLTARLLQGAKGRGEAQIALGAPATPRLCVVDLRWTGDLPAAVFGRIEAAIGRGALAGARVHAGAVRIPATIGDPTPFLAGADELPLRLAPGGFSQATEEGNALLARRAVELAETVSPEPSTRSATVLELFAGAGNLTVLLARTRDVVAVELDADACAAARANLSARGLTARVVQADASRHEIPKNARLVVLDPPRAGAKEVARALAQRPTPAVVYVSCDPPTLGRDLSILAEAGYVLEALETFEMFPQTSHVETIAALSPPPRKRT